MGGLIRKWGGENSTHLCCYCWVYKTWVGDLKKTEGNTTYNQNQLGLVFWGLLGRTRSYKWCQNEATLVQAKILTRKRRQWKDGMDETREKGVGFAPGTEAGFSDLPAIEEAGEPPHSPTLNNRPHRNTTQQHHISSHTPPTHQRIIVPYRNHVPYQTVPPCLLPITTSLLCVPPPHTSCHNTSITPLQTTAPRHSTCKTLIM